MPEAAVSAARFPLAAQQLIAVLGFAAMSLLAVILSFQWKFLEPIAALTTAVEVTAKVQKVDAYGYAGSQTPVSFNVQYAFQHEGKNYGGITATSSKPGETIQIWYVPGNPRKSDSDLKGHAIIDLVIFAIPAGVLVICSLILIVHLRARRQNPAP